MIVYAITLGFMALDFVSGLTKAMATCTFTSTGMRQGLFHKVALMLCLILGYAVDFAQDFIDLGVTVPVGGAICLYIIFMEIASITENLVKINPEIAPEKIRLILAGKKEGRDD